MEGRDSESNNNHTSQIEHIGEKKKEMVEQVQPAQQDLLPAAAPAKPVSNGPGRFNLPSSSS